MSTGCEPIRAGEGCTSLSRRAFLGRLLAAAAVVAAGPVAWKAARKVNAAECFQVGDVFTIAGKFALDPKTLQPTKYLKRFIATAVVTADEIAADPRMIASGAYMNVSNDRPFTARDITPDYFNCGVVIGGCSTPALGCRIEA